MTRRGRCGGDPHPADRAGQAIGLGGGSESYWRRAVQRGLGSREPGDGRLLGAAETVSDFAWRETRFCLA